MTVEELIAKLAEYGYAAKIDKDYPDDPTSWNARAIDQDGKVVYVSCFSHGVTLAKVLTHLVDGVC